MFSVDNIATTTRRKKCIKEPKDDLKSKNKFHLLSAAVKIAEVKSSVWRCSLSVMSSFEYGTCTFAILCSQSSIKCVSFLNENHCHGATIDCYFT